MARGRKRPARAPKVGLYTGPLTQINGTGHAARKSKRPGSDKGQGMWRCSPYYRTAVTVDARWSA